MDSVKLKLIGLLLLAFAIRAIGLDAIPPALNSDELLKPFDGASVYRTGMDHHGDDSPLFFKQSGEYSPPLYIYFSGLFSGPFGVNVYTTRLPSAILGTLSILFIFLFVRELLGNQAAWITAILVTLSPWHIHYSRMGWEAITLPVLLYAALWLFLFWQRFPTLLALFGAASCLALTFYSYPTARLFTPMMLIALCLLYQKYLRHYFRQTNIAFLWFVFLTIPFVVAMINHRDAMQARWMFLSVFQQENGFLLFIKHYFLHLSPDFLFFRGDANPLHALPGGLALMVLLPFFVLGLVYLIKLRQPNHWLLLIWLLIFAIPSSMTYDRYDIHSMPNALRSSCGIGLLEIISTFGILQCLSWLHSTKLKKVIGVLVGLLITANALFIAWLIITVTPTQSAHAFQYGLKEAVLYLEEHKADYDQIVVSPNVRLHPVSLAVFSGFPPQPFTGDDFPKYIIPFLTYVPIYRDFGFEAFQQHQTITRWYTQSVGKNLLLVKAGEITVGDPIHQIFFPDGSVAYEVYENRNQ